MDKHEADCAASSGMYCTCRKDRLLRRIDEQAGRIAELEQRLQKTEESFQRVHKGEFQLREALNAELDTERAKAERLRDEAAEARLHLRECCETQDKIIAELNAERDRAERLERDITVIGKIADQVLVAPGSPLYEIREIVREHNALAAQLTNEELDDV